MITMTHNDDDENNKSDDNNSDRNWVPFMLFKYMTQSRFQILDCAGPLKPWVFQSTAFSSSYPASSVLILAETDAKMVNGKRNFWLAEQGRTSGQGFTLKVDACARMIAGFHIKNLGKGISSRATRDFRISGIIKGNNLWQTFLEDRLVDTRFIAAPLLNFTFEEPVEIQFLKFDLVSYWGNRGGALQFFAAIPTTSKKH